MRAGGLRTCQGGRLDYAISRPGPPCSDVGAPDGPASLDEPLSEPTRYSCAERTEANRYLIDQRLTILDQNRAGSCDWLSPANPDVGAGCVAPGRVDLRA